MRPDEMRNETLGSSMITDPVREKEEYRPDPNDLRKRHPITIEFLDSGCVVRIGCKSIAFNDYRNAMEEINAYIKDPITAYQKWGKELGVELY